MIKENKQNLHVPTDIENYLAQSSHGKKFFNSLGPIHVLKLYYFNYI